MPETLGNNTGETLQPQEAQSECTLGSAFPDARIANLWWHNNPAVEAKKNEIMAPFEIVSPELRKRLNFPEFAANLVGLENIPSGDEQERSPKKRRLARNIDILLKVLRFLPVDVQTIKMRQAFIAQLLDNPDSETAPIEKLEKLWTTVNKVKGMLACELDGYYPYEEYRYRIERDGSIHEYFVSGEAEKDLDTLKEATEFLPEDDGYAGQLKRFIADSAKPLREFVERLRASHFISDVKLLEDYHDDYHAPEATLMTREAHIIATFKQHGYQEKIKGGIIRGFQKYCKEISKKGEYLDDFRKALDDFTAFISLAETVHDASLKQVDIVPGTALELREARHPRIVKQAGNKGYGFVQNSAVPINVEFSDEKPILIISGDNEAGKSKFVETVIYNCPLIQATGYGLVEGGAYSPRPQINVGWSIPGDPNDQQYSRGKKEMTFLAKQFGALKPGGVMVLDETLTSTDSLGGIAITLALMMKHAEQGGLCMLTVHSRELQTIYERNLCPKAQFVRTNPAGKYQFIEGVGRADPFRLAEESGVPNEVITIAKKIAEQIENALGASTGKK